MGTKARQVLPGDCYLITRRTVLQYMLLRPDEDMTQCLLYLLAVSASKFGIAVHAVCAMSTHLHLVATDVKGVLPDFWRYFHRLAANCTKALRGWEGSVWDSRPTSAVKLLTPEAVVKEAAYVLANPVAAGLVEHAHEWPGAKVLVEQIGCGEIRARRPKAYLDQNNPQWPEEATLAITLPPNFAPEEGDAFRRRVKAELEDLEARAHTEMKASKRAFLGAKKAMQVPVNERAQNKDLPQRCKPTFALGRKDEELVQRARDVQKEFRKAYQNALARWKEKERDVVFPAGTWWMRVFHRVSVSDVVMKV